MGELRTEREISFPAGLTDLVDDALPAPGSGRRYRSSQFVLPLLLPRHVSQSRNRLAQPSRQSKTIGHPRQKQAAAAGRNLFVGEVNLNRLW